MLGSRYLIILLLLVGLLAPTEAAASLATAKKRLQDEVRTWGVLPKVDLGVAGIFEVHPDGRPTERRQGRMGSMAMSGIAQQKKHRKCMEKGLLYKPRVVKLDIEGERLRLGLFSCCQFLIAFGHPVTAADLEPATVARALSGFFEIRGANVPQSTLETELAEVLDPIEVGADRAFFQGLAFSHPPGWSPERYGRELYYRGERKLEIRLRARSLDGTETEAGAQVLLEEALPRRLLKSARKLDDKSRVENLAKAQFHEGLVFGWADVVYKKTYERHDWIIDPERGYLYTFRSQGRTEDRQLFTDTMARILATLRKESAPVLAQSSPGASPDDDLPTPRDLGLPGEPDRPYLRALEVGAKPAQLARGETVELGMSYEIGGPREVTVRVRESRTLIFQGQVLPGYPIVEQSELLPGSFTTVLPETIPDFAEPGRYQARFELCVESVCEVRTGDFEVVW